MCRVLCLFQRRGHTLRSKLYATKIPQKSTVLWVKFVASSQWTVVRFLVGANRFHGDWMSIVNDPRSGRPRTSTDENMESLWQMLLKKIVVKLVKNFLEPREQILRRKMHMNRPQLLVSASPVIHVNARPHIADFVIKKLRDYRWEVLLHASYSPDMSLLHFDLFPN